MKAILHFSEFDWKEVEREFQRALKLSKESPFVWWTYSLFYLAPMRRFDEAVIAAQNALELDPLSPLLHWQLGHRYFYLEKYDSAIEEFQNTLELDPQYNQAYWMLGLSYCLTGKIKDGIEACETAVALGGSSSHFLGSLAMAYLLAGRTDDSRNLLNKLLDRAQKEYVSPMGIAYIYILLDEKDKAFDWLNRAYEERDGMIINIHLVPFVFGHLQADPRYKALIRKMNLEP